MRNFKSSSRHVKKYAMISLLILPACTSLIPSKGKIKPVPAHVSFCDAGEPIYWNKSDTAKTVAQIKEYNAVGVALKCPKWVTQ